MSESTLVLEGVGPCTVTAAQVGNTTYLPAAAVTRTFAVQYAWSGFLPPINVEGTSIFKLGSAVPVKFRLTGASSGVTNLAARLYLSKLSNGIAGTELEVTPSTATDIGNVFRYDAAAGQYIFVLKTKDLSEGTWQLRADLQDADASRTVVISLRN